MDTMKAHSGSGLSQSKSRCDINKSMAHASLMRGPQALGAPSKMMFKSSIRQIAPSSGKNVLETQKKSLVHIKCMSITHSRRPDVRKAVTCHASANAASLEAEGEKNWQSALKLGLLFVAWYGANIYFNIYNKQVLKAFPYPMTCTAIQFAIGSLIACFMWITGILKKPSIEPGALKAISPLAGIHVLGNVLTNVSLRAVAPSFTHTVKAAEPLFSVILSSVFLGTQPSLPVVLSLLPIIAGVVLASTSEITFNWTGFLAALGSNITFQSRNVLSKKFMLKGKAGLDNINLFSILTIMSFFLLAPLAVLTEGIQLTPAAVAALPPDIIFKGVIAGLSFHAYQQISYMILQRVTPVTHAVGNCVKRVVVIVASVIAFNTPVSSQNAFGTALALAGVFLYSQAKRMGGDKEKAKSG